MTVATVPTPTSRRTLHPTPAESIRIYVEQAEQSYRRHLDLGHAPAEAYAIVVGARAPFEEDDVVAAVVRAVTTLHHETVKTWRSPAEPATAHAAAVLVVDANGDPVPGGVPDGVDPVFYVAWMAGRVPAAACPHYLAASEARAGFTTCERCR